MIGVVLGLFLGTVVGLLVIRFFEGSIMTDRDYLRQAECERDAWKALAEARSDLLVAYRLHRPVTEAVLKRIDDARELLRKLEA